MLAAIEDVHDLAITTNGYLLERDAAALVEAGREPLQRLDRLAAARPLLRDDAPRRAAAGAARAGGARGVPRRRTRSRSTRSRCAASPSRSCRRSSTFAREHPYEVRFIEFMPLDGDHAWRPEQVLTGEEIRAAIDALHPLERAAARAARDRAHLPLRRRPRPGRLHQPRHRAVLRRLQPHPPDRRRHACAPASSRCNETDLRGPLRAGAERRRAGGDRARRRLAQGAQAPRERAGLRAAGAHDVGDRRLSGGRMLAPHAARARIACGRVEEPRRAGPPPPRAGRADRARGAQGGDRAARRDHRRRPPRRRASAPACRRRPSTASRPSTTTCSQPRGARHVRVCTGTACFAATGDAHVDALRDALGLELGERTRRRVGLARGDRLPRLLPRVARRSATAT